MRKIRLSDVQNHILRMLAEAGEETWLTVLATLRSEGGCHDEHSIAEAAKHLVDLGFVQHRGPLLILTEQGRESLRR